MYVFDSIFIIVVMKLIPPVIYIDDAPARWRKKTDSPLWATFLDSGTYRLFIMFLLLLMHFGHF